MPKDDFMISMTKIDFDVDLISTCGESALFAALRKGGSERVSTANGPWQTHVMGVWHFVAVPRIKFSIKSENSDLSAHLN